MNKKEIIEKLKSLQDAFENIGDICDETEFTSDDQLDAIRLRANGELAELEQMIIKLEIDAKTN